MNDRGFPQVLTSERPSSKERIVASPQGDGCSDVRASRISAHNEALGEGHAERRRVLDDLGTNQKT